jgi:tRNA (guanine-N7-)-methyltransferase
MNQIPESLNSLIPGGDSSPITSNQPWVHPRLPETVRKHLQTEHQKPIASHNQTAFSTIVEKLQQESRPLVLDSFCGSGHSTLQLAHQHPDHLVLGIDKSAHRLSKSEQQQGDNFLLVQAECEDIWRLLLQHKLCASYHYLLYPNPWPKAKHLGRRIHGHASFADLLRLGGTVELRSNWLLYVEEFGLAMHLAARRGSVSRLIVQAALTLHEQKYEASGHPLWRYQSKASS